MGKTYRILVVDDEAEIRSVVTEALLAQGWCECIEAQDGAEALERVRAGGVSLVLSDLKMPRMSGAELLEAIQAHDPEMPVLIMTGYGTIEGAVELLRKGAYDYITKPFKLSELNGRVGRALERVRMMEEIRDLRSAADGRVAHSTLVGGSAAMRKLLDQLPSVARAEASVILYGESGTGKEVVARVIHAMSSRATKGLVTVNCGALPDSLLENELFGHARGAFTDARDNYSGLIKEADGGTLLLDEIGEITPATQVKLLRFLQDKEYRPLGSTRSVLANVRIIAATNRDLRKAITEGRFREDLFYRLNIIPLTLPPLRERRDDIPLLSVHFLRRIGRDVSSPVETISADAMLKLMSYDWPGNVRELENKIQQIVALATGPVVEPGQFDLPASDSIARPDGRLKSYKEAKREVVDAFEVGYISKVLAMTGGNISEAARLARKHRRAFWEIMKKHGLRARPARVHEAPEEALVG